MKISDTLREIGSRALNYRTFFERGEKDLSVDNVVDALEHMATTRSFFDGIDVEGTLAREVIPPSETSSENYALDAAQLQIQYDVGDTLRKIGFDAQRTLTLLNEEHAEDAVTHLINERTREQFDVVLLSSRMGAYLLTGDTTYDTAIDATDYNWILDGLFTGYSRRPETIEIDPSLETISARNFFALRHLETVARFFYAQNARKIPGPPYLETRAYFRQQPEHTGTSATLWHPGIAFNKEDAEIRFGHQNDELRIVRRLLELGPGHAHIVSGFTEADGMAGSLTYDIVSQQVSRNDERHHGASFTVTLGQ